MSPERTPEPTELVYVPSPSWQPALLAAGLAGLIAGTFTWWPYALAGGIVALAALALWVRDLGRDLARLPRRQRVSSAPIPPARLESSARR